MSERKSLIPEFGPFAGMRVIASGSLIAMPFAASMLAAFGAEVIQIERPGVGDTMRGLAPIVKEGDSQISAGWAQEARNRLSLTMELNLKHPEVKEAFYGLIKEADVFMENMVWLEKLGIYDEELMKINPKLIIVHVSGYGNPAFGGIPEYCDRASYDMIGQAFSGWMNMNGNAGEEPMVAKPWLNDYVSAMCALFGVLAAYTQAQKTGKGQVVDVAQFEAMSQYMSDVYVTYNTLGVARSRAGNKAAGMQPYGLFKSKDGFDVAIGAFGPGVYGRFIKAVGFDAEYFNYKDCSINEDAVASPKGRELDAKIIDWCAAHTAQEIEDILGPGKVPCSRVNTAKECMEHDHYKLRDNWVTYRDQTLDKEITAFGIAPKLSATPGKVWRGAPALGQDTDTILKELLNYDDAKIAELREKKLV